MPSSPPTHVPFGDRVAPKPDTLRGSASARGYGRAWQRARLAFLARHPVCECAAACGRPATEVHHRVPHRGDPALFWDPANWCALTRACHAALTAREGARPVPGGG